jgi:hypothetical protein
MTKLDIVLYSCFALGFILMFYSVIYTNLSVQKMRHVLNSNRSSQDQLGWSDAVQKVAQNVIDMYRATYPDGLLYRNLIVGYYILGIGLALSLGSAFGMKFVN